MAGVDYFIGEPAYIGKGYAATILKTFIETHCASAKRVTVDPIATNARAIHVYEKCGFKYLADFYKKNIHYNIMVLNR